MENTLTKPMTGIIPPLVTPLLDNDKMDIDGLERLIAVSYTHLVCSKDVPDRPWHNFYQYLYQYHLRKIHSVS